MKLYAKFEEDGSFLPLQLHLKDTLDVADYLVDHWLSDSVKNYLSELVDVSQDRLKRVIKFLAYVHDIGKATPYFQKDAWNALGDRDCDHPQYNLGSVLPATKKMLHHSTMGAAILKEFGFDDGIVVIVGSHHGRWRASVTSDYFEDYETFLTGVEDEEDEGIHEDLFSPVWEKIVTEGLREAGLKKDEIPQLKRTAQILLTGFLNMADWLASDTKYFPLFAIQTNQDEVLKDRFKNAKEKFQITEPWKSHAYISDEEDFEQVFSFPPRSVQKNVIELLDEIDGPGLMIIEAPMGCGKTEAALYAVRSLAFRGDCGGMFFGLPTIATTNGILGRIYNWAQNEADDGKLSMQLVHGKTMFNEEYQSLKQKDFESEKLVVSDWMEKRKLRLCPNFVIGTIDSLLQSVLKHNHVMMDHIGMAGKVIVLDEIHSYDAYTNQYLTRCLEWLGWYRSPVILLSATLTPSLRKELIDAYTLGYKNLVSEEDINQKLADLSYPLVTFVSSKGIHTAKGIEQQPSKEIQIKQLEDWTSVTDAVQSRLQNGGCVGIIVNTVRKAQELYTQLKPLEKEGFKIKLFHSYFTDGDRESRESAILPILGKPENPQKVCPQRDKLIAIGTQVLEQSLDIDFDWMITQICPVDLLFQRIGRLHRHQRKHPESFENPECWIVGTDCQNLDSGTRRIYSDWLLEKTIKVMHGRNSLILPSDIPVLIREVYEDKTIENDFEQQAKNEYTKIAQTKKQNAEAWRLASPFPELKNMKELLSRMTDLKGNSGVRDCGISIEVILIATDYREIAYTSEKEEISLLETPDYSGAKKLLRSKVKLPSMLSEYHFQSVLEELERKTEECCGQWLRNKLIYGELILPLDLDWKGSLLDWDIKYSTETGLSCQKGGDDSEKSECSG